MDDEARRTAEDGGAAEEDPSVLGNLPRSRPGERSKKRTTATSARAAGKAERRDRPAAWTPQARRPRRPDAAEAARERAGADPVGDALRAAGQVAGAGLRIASGVTREVLRRLPRP